MTQEIPRDLIRFKENMDEISALVNESFEIVSESAYAEDNLITERARSYWYPIVEMQIYDTTQWAGGSMCSMENTLRELLSMYEIEIDKEDDLEDIFCPTDT